MKSSIRLFGIIAFVAVIGFGITACDIPTGGNNNGNGETRSVTVNISGTGASGVTHNAPATISRSATELVVTLSNTPADATITATGATVAGNEVTSIVTPGASALTLEITVTAAVAGVPVVTITSQPVSAIVTLGAITGSLSVAATITENATLSYQWQSQDEDNGSWINAGTNSDTFPIPTDLAIGVHAFRVVISAAGGATAFASGRATVTVTETPAETRSVTVNISGTGASGVNHNAPATILQSATELAIILSNVPANATVTATGGTVAGNVVTFAFAAGASALTLEITVTADELGVILTPDNVIINESNLTATVNVTGAATGDITLDTSSLPANVIATVSGTTITVAGFRQSTAINGTFPVGVTRQGVTRNLSVAVNIPAAVTAPTVILSSNNVTINDGNLFVTVNVTGTATGAITLNTADLPTGVTAYVSGTTIMVIGSRQSTAINGTFTVGVTRQGVTQNLSVAVNLTVPPIMLSTPGVQIHDGNLTATVNVTGAATGAVTLNILDLPAGVTATVSGTTITVAVTGARRSTAINDTFFVGVTRQGWTRAFYVSVSLTAVASGLPTTPGLFLGAPENLTPLSTPIAGIDNNLSSVRGIVGGNAANVSAYTLLLDRNVTLTVGSIVLNNNQQLTIIGIGSTMRTIMANTGSMEIFWLRGANASLTLGNNINITNLPTRGSGTVVWVNNATASFTMLEGSALLGTANIGELTDHIVHVSSGNFTMNGGIIAGNTTEFGTTVFVNNGTFTMNAGEITGNTNLRNIGIGGVVLSNSTFNMNGGRIAGNTGGPLLPPFYSVRQQRDVTVGAASTFNNSGGCPHRNF